jgi:hypothetical protein
MIREIPRLLSLVVIIGVVFATQSHAEVLELEGTVKSIDREARTVSIARKTSKGEKVLDLEVAKNAGDLSSIEDGDEVSITYDSGLELIASIAEKVSGDALLVAGSEWTSDDKWMRLRILSRQGDQYTALYSAGPNVLREIQGTVSGEKLQWISKNVTAHKGARGGDNSGKLSQDSQGPKLDFMWKDDNGNSGEFVLRKVSSTDESEPGDVAGVYDIRWTEASGNKGTVRYELKEDGVLVRAGKDAGSWELADGVIQIRFSEAARGFAVVRVIDADSLEGTHTKGDGTKTKWKGSKVK